ncbi:hypothetical protein [Glycomyces salinus]|uniref:hypothetical protein n=1 Tax=Glycomyces salinus TaxID=980294 RepID=UPI0018EC1EA4|nr:hypothetical protein [Glycomyces salinus]
MAFLSLPRDPVPAWVKIDLQLHQPYRTLLGFGRLRCDWCGEKWGRHGCPSRESAARLFTYTASRAQKEAALLAGEITPADLKLRPRRPVPNRPAPAHPTGRHRRRPRPTPETGPSLVLTSHSHARPRPDRNSDRPTPRRFAGVGA